MFKKFATATIIGAEMASEHGGVRKAGHRAVFDYTPREGYLYVRSRMISSRVNENFDEFPADEIKKAWKTAIGKPVFVNHHNEDHKRMRGVIIDAALHEDVLPNGEPDTWIEALHELDAKRFPKLAEAIIAGRVNSTSMGTDVAESRCTACGNVATTPAQYCQHVPKMKGRIHYRHTASGQREGHLIREVCSGLSFFENSFLVEDPADPTARAYGIDTRGLQSTAAKQSLIPGQGELFDLPPGAQEMPAPKSQKPSDGFSLKDGPLSWDDIGARHPALYGDHEYHGAAARHSDGSGIGEAANYLAHDRDDDPEAEGSSVHDLAFHSEMVHPDHIDNAYSGSSDPRVQQAERGYESDPKQVPPLVLVHRHGVYQVADGHHRAEAAERADKKVRAYVAYSPHSDEPFSDGGIAPYHSAERHPGVAKHRPKTAAKRPDWMPQQSHSYYGTHCLVCGEEAKHYPPKAHINGGWSHHDGLKRDHPALPADPDKVINSIPAADAQRDQMGQAMRNQLGLPSLRDREMPPDPFRTGSLRKLAEDYVECGDGHTHWGPHGAAGMLIKHDDPHDGQTRYLLQKRAPWVDHGNTWGVPGGALHEDESPHEGALRETEEEMGKMPSNLTHHRTHTDDHDGWAYHTVVMDSPHRFEPRRDGEDDHETAGHGWYTKNEMNVMNLHPGFAHSLKRVTASMSQGEPFTVVPKGNKVLVVDAKGDTRGEHATESDARAHQAALYASLPDAGDRTGTQNPKSSPDAPTEIVRARMVTESALTTLSYGETTAPADVDTLRTERCPVCGDQDSYDGDRCKVCNFLQPPAMFTDPDTGVAKQMDLDKVPFDQGEVGPNGEPIPGVDDQPPPMEGEPGTPGDQIADLFCPACGFSADTQPPMTNNDPAMPSGQQGVMEGDVCPECQAATMLDANDVGAMGGEVPQEVADDADADAIPDDEEPDEDGDGIPDDAEAETDEDGDGVPDETEEQEGEPEEDEGEPVEDEDLPTKGRKDDNARRAVLRGTEGKNMTKQQPTRAASGNQIGVLRQTVARQERQLAMQRVALETQEQKLHYLANLAGVSKEFNAITAQGQKKIADIMNPAQPVPDPPSGPPTEPTAQVEAPQTYDDPRAPGITPGSTYGVPAQQVDTPLRPGVTMPTSPYDQLVDPSAPIAGTEGQLPLDQVKIETDVRVGDPANPATAFPLNPEFAQDGAAYANQATDLGAPTGNPAQRTMASLRLARLRKSAGLAQGQDEFVIAATIERTATLTTAMIEHEITTLEAVSKTAGRGQGRQVKQPGNTRRAAPSLVSTASYGSGEGFDASDASDLFMDL